MMDFADARTAQNARSRGSVSLGIVVEALATSAALTLFVSYRQFEPIWQVGSGMLGLGLATALAYLVGRVASELSGRREPTHVASIAAVVMGPLLFALLLLDVSVSRFALVGELALLVAFLFLGSAPVRGSVRAAISVVLLGVAAYPTLAAVSTFGETTLEYGSDDVQYQFSSYHDLSVTSFPILAGEVQDGGAITAISEGRILLVAGNGEARILTVGDGLAVSTLDLHLPLDVPAYRAQVQNPDKLRDYRVTDALYSDGRLLVAYTHWHLETDCFTLRLVEAEFVGAEVGQWTTRFDSDPCLGELTNQAGGRIEAWGASDVLLSVGDFSNTHWPPEAHYGQIIRLDRDSWRAEVFSRGHRNPQGLLVSDGAVWSTEHGPQGGDELNLLEPLGNYGWPQVSYGTDYGKKTLSIGATPGDHSGFVQPIYAWTPSIGVSELIEISGTAFPLWEGDLLVASLSGQGHGEALFRVRLVAGRVVNVERIPTGRRVRDLLEIPGGLVLWDGRGVIQIARPADHVFSTCVGCHTMRPDISGIGPDLVGVVGSSVARRGGFEYSAALERYGGRWTPDRLDRFLRDPQAEVPGTTMEFDGITDPAERATIIEFLTGVSAGAAN